MTCTQSCPARHISIRRLAGRVRRLPVDPHIGIARFEHRAAWRVRRPAQGWVKRAVDRMLADGRLVGGDAMLRVQTERMAGHEARIKQHALKRGGRSSPLHNLNQDRRALYNSCSQPIKSDIEPNGSPTVDSSGKRPSQVSIWVSGVGRFDHLFGMFRTAAGKIRRLDLIFVPKPEFAFGYLGWVRGPHLLQ